LRMIATASPDMKPKVFRNCITEGATFVRKGAPRGLITSELIERAERHDLVDALGGREAVERIVAEGLADADHKAPRKTAKTPHQVAASDLYTVDSLCNEDFPMLKKIAGDIIVEGLTLLASRPKVGKTWLALDIAIAVDNAGFCLGDIKCEQGDVLFLALEDNKRRMQRRLTKLLGINRDRWPRFACAHTWPRADAGGLDRIRAWIENARNPRLVVIDVLARFRKRVPNGKQSYEADYETIAELQKIASDTGVAILVVHHTRKGEADDPIDAVSGTLGLAGAADAVLVIDRKAQGVRLYGRSRDVDEIDKAVTFNRSNCRWTILGETREVLRSNERQQIVEALREHGAEMTAKDIASVTGQKPGNSRRLLLKMATDGVIERVKYGVYTLSATPSNTGNNSNTS
jgi:AAA domain